MQSNWLSFDQRRQRVVGTPLAFDAPAVVRVRATDQQGASATTSFQVRIRPRTLGDESGQSTPSPDFDGTTDSTQPSISANGRFVAHVFESAEVDEQSIVVRDSTVADFSDRGSFTVAGPVAFDGSAALFSSPSISADGRTVAFVAQTAPEAEIQGVEIRVVRIVNSEPLELETKFVQSLLRSDDPIEREDLVRSTDVSLSANGRFLAFEQGTEIVVAKIGTRRQLVINDASSPSISGNGRRIAYEEIADLERRILVATLNTSNMTEVETVEAGFDIDFDFGPLPSNPVVSANGRLVAFESDADELVLRDNNGARDIFVYSTIDPRTTRVNVDSDGDEVDADSSNPSLSKNGGRIAFITTIPGINVFGEQISIEQVFVRELDPDGEPGGELRIASVNSDRVPGNGSSAAPAQSGDGRFVAFESRSSNLTADARENQGIAVFLASSSDDSRPVVDLPLDSLDDPGTLSLVLGVPTQGIIDPAFDVDHYSVQLIEGQAYRFVLQTNDFERHASRRALPGDLR